MDINRENGALQRTPGTLAWRLLWILSLGLGIGASLSFSGFLPQAVAAYLRPVCAGPVVLLLAALPLLVSASPAEPSWLKLLVLSGLLSPCWIGLGFLVARPFVSTDAALAIAFASSAVCAPLCSRRHLASDPIGRAATCASLLGVLAAAILGLLLWRLGAEDRLLQPGVVWHVGVLQALGRGLLENPWLAATELPTHPSYAFLGLLFSRCLGLTGPAALASIQVWSMALLPTLLYLWAAPLWREPRRVLATPLLALFGWNALGGLLPWGAPGEAASWPEWLARATPGAAPGQVIYGLAGWLEPAPWVPALTFATGAWMCAAHALRHGKRPWVGLCAVLHGVALLLDPCLGAGALMGTFLAAVFVPGESAVRPKVTLALLVAALPALALVRHFSPWSEPGRPWMESAVWLPAGLFLLMGLGLGVCRRGRWQDRTDRTLLVSACFASFALLCVPFIHPEAASHRAELARAASFPLALLAAGGLFDWIDRGGWRGLVGLLLGVATVAGGARNSFHVLSGFYALSSSTQAESPGHSVQNLTRCYAWIRGATELRGRDPILVREVADGRGRIAGERTPHPAAIATDLPMWCDLPRETAFRSPRWEPRNTQLHSLFNERENWNPRISGEWERVGRTIVFVIEEADRRRTHRGNFDVAERGIELRLQRLGATLVRRFGDAAVFVLEPSGP